MIGKATAPMTWLSPRSEDRQIAVG